MQALFKQPKNFFEGIGYYSKAFRFAKKHQLWGYFVLPAFINLIVFTTVVILAFYFGGFLKAYLLDLFNAEKISIEWLKTVVHYGLALVVYTLIAIVFFKSYKFFMLTLLTPFLAQIAEKVFSILDPETENHGFSMKRFLHDLWRGIQINVANLGIELIWTILFLILSFFIPFMSIITALIEAYFIGFGMWDYRCEMKKMDMMQTRNKVWKHRGLVTGVGMGFYLLMFIPFFGVLFAPILGVIAGSLAYFEKEEGGVIDI